MPDNKSARYAFLRMILPLLVLVGHAAVMYSPSGAIPPEAGSAFLDRLSQYIYAFHMPLFFVLSGALWGYGLARGKYREKGKFLKNKALRLLPPYLFFGICVVAPVMCLLSLTNQGFFGYVLHGILLSENARHLWYVLALFWVFVFSLAFRPMLEKWHPALCLALSLAVLYASQYLPFSVFQLQAALYYQFFFILGFYLDRWDETLCAFFRKCPLVPLLAPFALLARFVLPYRTATLLLYNLLGILFFCGLAALLPCARLREKPFPRLLEKDSFGLYLFHPMLVYLVFYFGRALSPWILFPLALLLPFALSIGLTELLRSAKLGILIGEK